jgi:hypothetical protein
VAAETLTMCDQTFSCVKDTQFLLASALAKKLAARKKHRAVWKGWQKNKRITKT